MEANESYWRKMPVGEAARLQERARGDHAAGHAQARRGRRRLPARRAAGAGGQARSQSEAGLLRRHRAPSTSTSSTSGIRSRRGTTGACGWPPTTPSTAQALSEAETLGRLQADRQPRAAQLRVRAAASSRTRTIRRRPSSSWPRPAIPNGFDAGELHQLPPYFSLGEAIVNYFQAVGIRIADAADGARRLLRADPVEEGSRACASASARSTATPPRGCRRSIPSDGAYAYGGYPDIDALYKQQARETDRKKREALLHQIQRLVHERVRYAPIYEYIWPSGIGPRVAEPALMLINPYPWSAPLEEVRLKKN